MKEESNKCACLSTVEELNKLKKSELIESIIKNQQIVEEGVLQCETIKKELLLIKEQLTATKVAIENIKTEKIRLTAKINQLMDENKILSAKLNTKECAVEAYASDYNTAIEKLRLTKFWIGFLIIVIVLLLFGIIYISNINLC